MERWLPGTEHWLPPANDLVRNPTSVKYYIKSKSQIQTHRKHTWPSKQLNTTSWAADLKSNWERISLFSVTSCLIFLQKLLLFVFVSALSNTKFWFCERACRNAFTPIQGVLENIESKIVLIQGYRSKEVMNILSFDHMRHKTDFCSLRNWPMCLLRWKGYL